LYDQFVEPEQFDPRDELKRSKSAVESYLRRRADFAYKAKVSLEVREVVNGRAGHSDEEVNRKAKNYIQDPKRKTSIPFYVCPRKLANDRDRPSTVHDHSLRRTKVNETRNFTLAANANFYSLSTSSIASAVHIPTPLYDRNPELLRKIEWSQIDEVYRTHREETRDLAFQLFCSESGYMRFFPAASWFWDNHIEHLDLFDCRNTQWYINAATNSKNVIIMLDMSGSMLGQRYEIAKQTTEAILETLSHNDYFNIMPFSKTSYFLDDCNGKNGLLQATMRNKKLLRNKMNNVSSEGKAEYEKALPHAFTTLLNLPGHYELHTREEMALMEPNATEERIHVVFPEHVLSADPEYIEAISSHHGRPDQGCENVIMLITDGAPNVYKEIFDLYNKDKKVRFFSFLIGEEAIDFEQVKTMACTNRGYMVHVQNMADVEDKVQHYIRTMSRPIGQNAADIQVDDALWSGVYRERLYAIMNKMAARRKIRLQKTEARGRMFVTTVSFPVIVNGTFMGVAAVNTPLTELNQQAHPSNDPLTRSHKQNYNNMDLLELEVPQTQQVTFLDDDDLFVEYETRKCSDSAVSRQGGCVGPLLRPGHDVCRMRRADPKLCMTNDRP
ncbi:von Willebrand factor type A domain protein, partial [Ostertagia ostertagi]